MIVVDANVAIKWYVPEAGEDAAQAVLSLPEMLIAPHIIKLEVLSAIARCVRDQRCTPAEARKRCALWMEQLEEQEIRLIADEDLFEDAIALSTATKHPLADCLYLALTKRFKATLVTFDEKLAKLAKKNGAACTWLREDH